MTETNDTKNTTQAGYVDFTLPSGRKGKIMRRRVGRHLELAARVAGSEAGNPITNTMALVTQVCILEQTDGTFGPTFLDELREFTIQDTAFILNRLNEDDTGKGVAGSPSSSSPSSGSTEGSGTTS